eukprot:3642959-Amphidinium_carterae.2
MAIVPNGLEIHLICLLLALAALVHKVALARMSEWPICVVRGFESNGAGRVDRLTATSAKNMGTLGGVVQKTLLHTSFNQAHILAKPVGTSLAS